MCSLLYLKMKERKPVTKTVKYFSLIIAVVLIFSMLSPVASAAAVPFQDVPPTEWFADAVAWAYANEIARGFPDNTFRPHADVTRGEFVTFLYRLLGEPPTTNIAMFRDVTNPSRFYFSAVNWAASIGVTTGYPNGTFRPNNNITREELATMLFRFAGFSDGEILGPPEALHRFPDRDTTSDFAVEGLRWATNRGIVQGNSGAVLPRARATRAESLTMLYRYAMDVPFTPPPPPDLPPPPYGSHSIYHCYYNGFPSNNRWVGRNRWAPDIIVLHTTASSTQSAINTSFGGTPSNRTSYHFIIASDGTITQTVPITDTAWGNGTSADWNHPTHIRHASHPAVRSRQTNANFYTVSIGFGDASAAWRGGQITYEQITAGAWLIQHIRHEIWENYGIVIPINRSTVIGHSEITRTLCPGPNFPFDPIIQRAR